MVLSLLTKNAQNERFVIKCFIIVYHWYANLLAYTEC